MVCGYGVGCCTGDIWGSTRNRSVTSKRATTQKQACRKRLGNGVVVTKWHTSYNPTGQYRPNLSAEHSEREVNVPRRVFAASFARTRQCRGGNLAKNKVESLPGPKNGHQPTYSGDGIHSSWSLNKHMGKSASPTPSQPHARA